MARPTPPEAYAAAEHAEDVLDACRVNADAAMAHFPIMSAVIVSAAIERAAAPLEELLTSIADVLRDTHDRIALLEDRLAEIRDGVRRG